MNGKLLFVTQSGVACDEGFSYALDLARSLNAGLEVLVVYAKQTVQGFEDLMAAAAFAEAGDFKTVKEIMDREEKEFSEAVARKMEELSERCRQNSVEVVSKENAGDMAAEISGFVKDRPGIKMVVISPALGSVKKLSQRLLKGITKPIVYVRPVKAEA